MLGTVVLSLNLKSLLPDKDDFGRCLHYVLLSHFLGLLGEVSSDLSRCFEMMVCVTISSRVYLLRCSALQVLQEGQGVKLIDLFSRPIPTVVWLQYSFMLQNDLINLSKKICTFSWSDANNTLTRSLSNHRSQISIPALLFQQYLYLVSTRGA